MKSLTPLLLFFIFSCSGTEEKNINELEWMLGEWTSISGDESVTEKWVKSSDTELTGFTFFLSSDDTMATEQLKIVARNNNIVYVASPSGQETTEFKLTELKGNEVLFENPEHDFPKKIYYKRISQDSLYAKIEGLIHGQQQSMDFYLQRNNEQE